MEKLVLSLVILLLTACNSGDKVLAEQRKMWGFDTWDQRFKDRAFCLCLLEGYDNSEVKNFLLEHDKSTTDPIATTFFDPSLRSLISKEVETMKRDSLASIPIVSESAAGKRVFGHCLAFYKSTRLDSLVALEAPKWKTIKNITDSVIKRIPTF
jgi:hypothetical protein